MRQRAQHVREWINESSAIAVLCTTEYVSSVVRLVGGDQVHVLTLIPPQSDPHTYQLVKGDDVKFCRADCVFYSGLRLEEGATLEKYRIKYHAISIGEYIQEKTGRVILHGSIVDPHIWHDLGLFAEGVFCISQTLSKIRPEKAEYFHENAKKWYDHFQKVHRSYQHVFATIDQEKRYFVTTHDAFHYFVRAYLATDGERDSMMYQNRYMTPEGFSPEAQISTQDIQNVVDFVRQHKITKIFTEMTVNSDSIQKVAEILMSSGIPIQVDSTGLYSDTMGEEKTLEEVFRYNCQKIFDSFLS